VVGLWKRAIKFMGEKKAKWEPLLVKDLTRPLMA
jgi:hypothetical protein